MALPTENMPQLSENDRRVAEKLRRELGPIINRLLAEPDVVEIMLNPDGVLWSERLGGKMEVVGRMDAHQAESMMNTIASCFRVAVTRESPILECELPFDGSRFEGLIPPIVAKPTFAIRRKAHAIFSLASYVSQGMMTEEHRTAICAAVDDHKNILVVGGTGSGKTTLTNAVIGYMAEAWPDERLVIIEDTGELQCASQNAVQLRAVDGVDMLRLLKATLRLRPDRILVGEVRGPEAMTLIDSWNTGHPGGVATVHANDAASGLIRVESLVRRGLSGGVPVQEIAAAVNVVVCIAKTNQGRRITEVVTVTGHDGNNYLITKN